MALRAVLVDLGGTLIDFFGNGTAAQMVPRSLASVRKELFELWLGRSFSPRTGRSLVPTEA